jgi:hypothetical protein
MRWLVMITAISAAVLACGEPDKAAEAEQSPVISAPVSNNPDVFNQSFENLLGSYYDLKDALVEYDTAKANLASKKLAFFADSLRLEALGNDSSGTKQKAASNFAGTIAGSALGFIGEKEWKGKKREFQMISDAMYDLTNAVNYNARKIYRQRCPMAFNDEEEAYWLSNSNKVVNPYLGRKHPKYKAGMLECGEVTDSLGFK